MKVIDRYEINTKTDKAVGIRLPIILYNALINDSELNICSLNATIVRRLMQSFQRELPDLMDKIERRLFNIEKSIKNKGDQNHEKSNDSINNDIEPNKSSLRLRD